MLNIICNCFDIDAVVDALAVAWAVALAAGLQG